MRVPHKCIKSRLVDNSSIQTSKILENCKSLAISVQSCLSPSQDKSFHSFATIFYLKYKLFIFNADDVTMTQRNGRIGRLLSPRHTLPPNTTCAYFFYGFPHDLIWLSFTSYHLQILQPVTHDNVTQVNEIQTFN